MPDDETPEPPTGEEIRELTAAINKLHSRMRIQEAQERGMLPSTVTQRRIKELSERIDVLTQALSKAVPQVSIEAAPKPRRSSKEAEPNTANRREFVRRVAIEAGKIRGLDRLTCKRLDELTGDNRITMPETWFKFEADSWTAAYEDEACRKLVHTLFSKDRRS